ncbi:hypothetical protein [Pseudomonas sp. BN102]|uniref:hypothetical protein n=1 Tax=Pseudomonas sp. BN102 TaxID=2567886 RepID=UPI00245426D3|nr:hypothetical protein [Pseudomonas sp. BN102]MDH4607448.1 hypothetical protein [Pseudomonas sp. BN102]
MAFEQGPCLFVRLTWEDEHHTVFLGVFLVCEPGTLDHSIQQGTSAFQLLDALLNAANVRVVVAQRVGEKPTQLQKSGLIASAASFSVKPNTISAATWATAVLLLRIAWLEQLIRQPMRLAGWPPSTVAADGQTSI